MITLGSGKLPSVILYDSYDLPDLHWFLHPGTVHMDHSLDSAGGSVKHQEFAESVGLVEFVEFAESISDW